MPLELTAQELDTLWESPAQKAIRATMQVRRDYFDGRHAITFRSDKYANGALKTNRVTNWIRYIINRYVGALTGVPYQVTKAEDVTTPEEGEEIEPITEPSGPDVYQDIAEDNELISQDVWNLHNSILLGIGIEVHSFDSSTKEIGITNYDPIDWMLLYDSADVLQGALYRITLPAGTVSGDTVLAEDSERMWYYNDSTITEYVKAGDGWKQADEPKPHEYGQVPLVVWQTSNDRVSFISKALIGQNDEYNQTDSASGDDIRNDSDAILVLPGLSSEWLTANEEFIRKSKMIPWPGEVGAPLPFYLTRNSDFQRIESRLKRTRDHIHIMGDVPDVEEITGATGDTSGIALRLKFTPMLQVANGMINYIETGMRRRIDLINVVQKAMSGGTIIENYRVTVQFTLPVNRIEEWKNAKELQGIVSHRTILELMSDVRDPELELERLRQETVIPPSDLTEEEQQATQEAEIEAMQVQLQPMIQTIIQGLSDATEENLISSGALDRIVKARTPANATT